MTFAGIEPSVRHQPGLCLPLVWDQAILCIQTQHQQQTYRTESISGQHHQIELHCRKNQTCNLTFSLGCLLREMVPISTPASDNSACRVPHRLPQGFPIPTFIPIKTCTSYSRNMTFSIVCSLRSILVDDRVEGLRQKILSCSCEELHFACIGLLHNSGLHSNVRCRTRLIVGTLCTPLLQHTFATSINLCTNSVIPCPMVSCIMKIFAQSSNIIIASFLSGFAYSVQMNLQLVSEFVSAYFWIL
jgi:hypothetical protein